MFQNILCRPPTLLAQCLAGAGRLGELPEQLGLRFRGRWRAPGGPCRTDVAHLAGFWRVRCGRHPIDTCGVVGVPAAICLL